MSKRFKIVEFLDYENDVKSVDIVPSEWIIYDHKTDELFTKFIPNNSKENVLELKNRVQYGKSPLKSWPQYRITVKGYADTYFHAEKKLLKLKTSTYAFTTENDEAINTQKENLEKEKYKLKGKKKNIDNTLPGIIDLNKPIEFSEDIDSSYDVPKNNEKIQKRNNRKRKFNQIRKDSSDELSESNIFTDFSNTNSNANSNESCSDLSVTYKKKKIDNGKEKRLINDKHVVTINKNEMNKEKETTINVENNIINPTEINDLSVKELILKCYRNLSAQIARLAGHVAEIKIKQDEMITSHSTQTHRSSNFKKLHDFLKREEIESLPFKTLESFEIFDAELKIDETFREDLINFMWSSIDSSKPLIKAVTAIMKKFMSRDVVLNYTAQKPKGSKKAIKDTTFGECMKDAVINEYKAHDELSLVKDDKFFQALGSVINNAKDWEGKRSERKLKE